jgi:hypothetical protein
MCICQNDFNPISTEIIKLLLNHDKIDVNLVSYRYDYNALMFLCENQIDQMEIAILLIGKTNLEHRNYQNKKIGDICLPYYKNLF